MWKNKKFRNFFIDYDGVTEEELKSYSEDKFYIILHDIVERRNYIAHGNDVDEILSLPILKSYVEYIGLVLECIYTILCKNLNIEKVKKSEKIDLGYPLEVYNNSIIGIKNQYHELRKGMFIFSENTSTKEIRCGKIISIEESGKKIVKISDKENVLLGIQVDFVAKRNYRFGIIKV